MSGLESVAFGSSPDSHVILEKDTTPTLLVTTC